MKRFLSKVGRFFWSWGFLKFVLWAVTLIALLYAEEDWRGARDWAQTKAKWEARGESFDFTRLIPPPIPDSQNLGALPLFKLEPDPQSGGRPGPVALRKALHYTAGLSISGHTKWQTKGTPSDLNAIRSDIATAYFKVFQTVPTNTDPQAQLEAIFPFIAELNAASATRPYCRFNLDYTSEPPYAREVSSTTLQLSVAKLLAIHATLALAKNQPDLALTDIETELKLNTGIAAQPRLVSGLVAIADTALIETAIYEGIARHAWSDGQLAQIESDLNHFDFLADYQLSIRGELIGFSIPTLDYLAKLRPNILNFFAVDEPAHPPSIFNRSPIFGWWPAGWFNQNKSHIADALLAGVAMVDPKTHRVFSAQAESLHRQAAAAGRGWRAAAPWHIFSSLAAPPILQSLLTFSRAQVWLDQMRIALALERYHLAHGAYPATLDELAPVYIADIPHDIINGEPYRYRLRPDGTFLLYSVGWNEKDEGGLVVTEIPASSDPYDSKDKHGDWVWPTAR